ncbi:troponin T, skeletal muscle-like isoform X24 [Argonauta hians]
MDEEDHTEEQTEQSTEETSQMATEEDSSEMSTTAEEGKGSSVDGAEEAKLKMAARNIRDKEKQAQEMAEYEEMRKEEREKDEREIKELRERRETRRKERQEEEKRLTELRKIEEARRKTEEEEKKKKKKEEEQAKKEERERKLKDAEERLKPKKPNYVIAKKGGEEGEPAKEPTSKEDMQKSKEQLEEEKRAILAQRIQPLNIDGLNAEKLREKAKEMHDHLRKLASDKFDCEENYKRQQKDLIELAERARQLSKGKGKKTSGEVQRVDDSFDSLADKYAGCPPKILLHSKYERLTDHRSYVERKDLYEKVSKEVEEFMEKERLVKEHQKEVRKTKDEGEGAGEGEEAGEVQETAAEEEAVEA